DARLGIDPADQAGEHDGDGQRNDQRRPQHAAALGAPPGRNRERFHVRVVRVHWMKFRALEDAPSTVPYWPRRETPRFAQLRNSLVPAGSRTVPTCTRCEPIV